MKKKALSLLAVSAFGAAMLVRGGPVARAAVGGPTCNVPADYPTIQAAVNDPACSTIDVGAGTYAENVTINRQVVLQGAGDNTIIAPTVAGPAITLSAGGASATSRTIIAHLKVTGASGGGNTGSGIRIMGGAAPIGHMTFDHVTSTANSGHGIAIDNSAVMADIVIQDSTLSHNTSGDGLRIPTSMVSLDGLTISGSHFDDNSYGFEAYNAIGKGPLTNVTIADSTFNNDPVKGIYVERLSNASLNGISVIDSGTAGVAPNFTGIDMNLKFAAFSNISLTNSTISGSHGAGVDIKGRNDAGYAAHPASLSGVMVSGVNVTNNASGIGVGNNVTGAHINQSNIQGNAGPGVFAYTDVTPIDATCNWWGAASGPGPVGAGSGDTVSPGVTYAPWLTAPAPGGACNGVVATDMSQCKDGGWANHIRADGTSFKNQGDCIQYVNTGK